MTTQIQIAVEGHDSRNSDVVRRVFRVTLARPWWAFWRAMDVVRVEELIPQL